MIGGLLQIFHEKHKYFFFLNNGTMNNNNNNKNIKPPYTRFHYAVTDMQKNSLAELKETYKYALQKMLLLKIDKIIFKFPSNQLQKQQRMIWNYYLI